MKKMAKHIKLLEADIRLMSKAQIKMHKDMEILIKKIVQRVSRPVFKETKKLTKSNDVLQQATFAAQRIVVDSAKFERIVNLQHTQYEEIQKVVEATTKLEGLRKVIESQANDFEELKATIETIQNHVVSHTVQQNETDRELALIPIIRDNQELMIIHMVDLIKTLNGDDAKNGKKKTSFQNSSKETGEQTTSSSVSSSI